MKKALSRILGIIPGKNFTDSLLVRVLSILVIAGLCNLIYIWTGLIDVFGKSMTFVQWLGITCIVTLLWVEPNSLKNNDH